MIGTTEQPLASVPHSSTAHLNRARASPAPLPSGSFSHSSWHAADTPASSRQESKHRIASMHIGSQKHVLNSGAQLDARHVMHEVVSRPPASSNPGHTGASAS